MFKINKLRTVEWPVLIQEPVDGGKTREREVIIEFEDLRQSEQDDIYKAGGNDTTLLKRVVRGWKAGQIKDQAEQDVVFSTETLAELLDCAYVHAAFIKAYIELHNGQAAKRKN